MIDSLTTYWLAILVKDPVKPMVLLIFVFQMSPVVFLQFICMVFCIPHPVPSGFHEFPICDDQRP